MTIAQITVKSSNSGFETKEQGFNSLSITKVNESSFEQNFRDLHQDKPNFEVENKDTNIDKVISSFLDESGNGVSNETVCYKHLKTYPIVDSWIKVFHWLPSPNVFRPMLMKMAYSDLLKNYTVTIDEFLDKKLNVLDTIVPEVQTLRIRDIRNAILDEPVRYAISETSKYTNHIIEIGDCHILKPSKKKVYNIRRMHSKYLNTSGKPLIRSHLDSFLKPLNLRMVNYINDYVAEKDTQLPVSYVTIGPQSNELSYTVRIFKSGLLHARPILRQRLGELRKTPSEMFNYAAAVYQRSKKNRGEGKIVVVIASIDTIRASVRYGYKLLSKTFFFQIIQSNPNKEKDIAVAEEVHECKD